MTPDQSIFIEASGVRQALVEPGDIRAEVEFQNDINGMLARMDDASTLEAVGGPSEPTTPLSARGLRVLRGGVTQARGAVEPPPFRLTLARTG